jgi:hypothetical protein
MTIKLISSVNQREIKAGDIVNVPSDLFPGTLLPYRVTGIKPPNEKLEGGLIGIKSNYSPFSTTRLVGEIKDVEWCLA